MEKFPPGEKKKKDELMQKFNQKEQAFYSLPACLHSILD